MLGPLHLYLGVLVPHIVDLDVNLLLGSLVNFLEISRDVVLFTKVLISKLLCHAVALDSLVVHFHEFLLHTQVMVGNAEHGDSIPELLCDRVFFWRFAQSVLFLIVFGIIR